MTEARHDKAVFYLSGPMSGIKDHNFPAFQAASRILRAAGLYVVSPHEVKHNDGGELGSLDHSEYLRDDLIVMLQKCNAIAFLPGWSASRGAQMEHIVASMFGFGRFLFQPDGTLEVVPTEMQVPDPHRHLVKREDDVMDKTTS